MLANTLKWFIGSIISNTRSTFITGNEILDGLMVVNEFYFGANKTKETIFFKVNFEKAFESLNSDFLDSIMMHIGFPITWNTWLQGCLSSSRSLVLINGSPMKEFIVQKGVRKGDNHISYS